MSTTYANEHITAHPGSILDVEPEEAEALIAAGSATPVDGAEVETAKVAAPENAARKAPAAKAPKVQRAVKAADSSGTAQA